MEFLQNNITTIITTAILISHIGFVLGMLLMVLHAPTRRRVYDIVLEHILPLLFVVSLGALVGSLAYSNIAGFPPCELCWIQRIFMYPQALLAFIAVIKKDKNIVGYLLPLSVLGAIVALYHSLTQWGFNTSVLPCTAAGGECSKVYVLEYGYITIPFMAFTTFAYLIALTLIYYKAKRSAKIGFVV